jgi:hypothetical protein
VGGAVLAAATVAAFARGGELVPEAAAPRAGRGGLVQLARLPLLHADTVTVASGFAYVSPSDELAIVDVHDPVSPTLRSQTKFLAESAPPATGRHDDAYIAGIALDGAPAHYAYLGISGFGDGALIVVDVSDPDQPREVAYLPVRTPPDLFPAGTPTPEPSDPANDQFAPVWDVVALGRWVHLATPHGVFGVDVSNPAAPRLLSDLPQWRGFALALAAEGNELAVVGYGADGNGLWLLDVAADGSLARRRFVDVARNQSILMQEAVALRDGRVAVANGEDGVVVVDANDAGAVPPLHWFRVPELSTDVFWGDDGLLYVAQSHNRGDGRDDLGDDGRGVRVIDPSQAPDEPDGPWTVSFQPPRRAGLRCRRGRRHCVRGQHIGRPGPLGCAAPRDRRPGRADVDTVHHAIANRDPEAYPNGTGSGGMVALHALRRRHRGHRAGPAHSDSRADGRTAGAGGGRPDRRRRLRHRRSDPSARVRPGV